jgi:hypothetical protein
MTLPKGSEQLLSLAWALENVAAFTKEDAIKAVCQVFGIEHTQWETCIKDSSWFVGDSRFNNREQIESKWNTLFSKVTKVLLDEDSWHTPLWQLWLREPKMIFAENLTYLIKARGRGTVVRLAKFTGRNTTTASKWGRWREEGRKVRLPHATLVPRILEFFDLKPSCNLYREPLFLGRAEIHETLLRNEGKHYLDCLSGEHLNQAVDRLREESVRQATKKRL